MKSIKDFLELIKFEHTVFALPFAYLGMLLAANGFPTLQQFIWITIAMASARTVAMGFNRIIDRHIDARNPRTANRPIVTGAISLGTAWAGSLVAVVILVTAAWQLGQLTLRLLPFALLFLLGYSYTKRFTWLSHFILGFTDGLAPLGAWLAVRGSLFTENDLPAWILLAIVTFWIGGFDLIYACQDVQTDKLENLHAIPAKFGIEIALKLSVISHVLTIFFLGLLGYWVQLGWIYWLGIVFVAGLLTWEHRLVKPEDLSQIDRAFFDINSYISVVLFLSVAFSVFLR